MIQEIGLWLQGNGAGWMTSVHEGLAGGNREAAEHGLPSLVNGVRDQTAASLLKCGGDEISLDRMGTKHRKGSAVRV